MHVGTVRIGGQKMAKSAGNLVLVSDLLAKHSPAVLRLMLLDRPWAAAWDFEPRTLAAAERRLEALYSAAGKPDGTPVGTAEQAVLDALLDDLNVSAALDVALDVGGQAARTLTELLGLH
jgi:cysteinyl-tRNA synthetase